MTDDCLHALNNTVDWDRHKLIVVSNGSCFDTVKIIKKWEHTIDMHVVWNRENVGQAAAINQGWKLARELNPQTMLGRIDNDVQLLTPGWLDLLEECIARDPQIGVAAAKRDDLIDSPNRPEGCWSKTSLRMLSHEKGQRWLVVEDINQTLGSIQLVSSELFNKIGYLDSFGLYGLEDAAYSLRAKLAGFKSCYVHGIGVHHMDDVGEKTEYQLWKEKTAAENMKMFNDTCDLYSSGKKSLFVDFSGDQKI